MNFIHSENSEQLRLEDLFDGRRAHSSIYTDQQIFGLEIDRIFHRTWLYVGHESEIAGAGDYVLRKLGRQPVIMVRGDDGQCRVLMNRCRHRGSLVCETEQGNARRFQCLYHGWAYGNDGALISVPGHEGYPEDPAKRDLNLTEAPRLGNYRGFIFASLVREGESFNDYIAPAAEKIDLLIDASPTSEIVVGPEANKTSFRGNWKLVGMDGYHPPYVHAAVVAQWRRKANEGTGQTHKTNSFDDESGSRTRYLGRGHAMLDLEAGRLEHFEEYCGILSKMPGGNDYVRDMQSRFGERAKLLIALAGDPHVGVFPNLQIINNQVRIVVPIAADMTQVLMFPVFIKGMSPAMNANRLRQHESFFGPAGAGSPDDAEAFERVQRGLEATVDPWIDLSRGVHREKYGPGEQVEGLITDEVPQRGQLKRWMELMTDGEARR